MDAHVSGDQPDPRMAAQQRRHRQRRRHRLRDDRGPCHALHAHAERHHEQQVQRDVQHRRRHQIVKRPPRIAHRAQNARAHVVKQQPNHAAEVDRQIGLRLRKDVLRRLHQPQHHGRHAHAHGAERHRQDDRQHNGRVHRVVHLFLPVRAIVLRDDHARAAGQTRKHADEHVHDRRHRAHRGKRLVAHIIAEHPGVHRIVQLLENVARQQRQRKKQDVPEGASLRHVHIPPPAARPRLFHAKSLLCRFLLHFSVL